MPWHHQTQVIHSQGNEHSGHPTAIFLELHNFLKDTRKMKNNTPSSILQADDKEQYMILTESKR